MKKTLNNKITEVDFRTIDITLEDDTNVTCSIEKIYEVKNQSYIALMPITEDGDPMEDEPLFYHYVEVDGNPVITEISDDEEYEIVEDRYDEILDEEEFEKYETHNK